MPLTFPVIMAGFLALGYFVYGLLWFLSRSRVRSRRRTQAWTVFGLASVLSASVMWFVAIANQHSLSWHAIYEVLSVASFGLCIAAIAASRVSSRRMALPILIGALAVAVKWIGAGFGL